MDTNPYAAPRSSVAADMHAGKDSADLFMETLPPPVLKGAGFSWLALGGINCLLCLRMLLGLEQNVVAGVLEAGHFALALACFAACFGLLRGYAALAVLALPAAPISFGASAFALVTGSLAGMAGMGLVVLAVALTLASRKAFATVAAARVALTRLGRAQSPTT
jgi:hypothetical protein